MQSQSLGLTVFVAAAAAALASLAAATEITPRPSRPRRGGALFRFSLCVFDQRVGEWKGAALTIQSPGGTRPWNVDRSS